MKILPAVENVLGGCCFLLPVVVRLNLFAQMARYQFTSFVQNKVSASLLRGPGQALASALVETAKAAESRRQHCSCALTSPHLSSPYRLLIYYADRTGLCQRLKTATHHSAPQTLRRCGDAGLFQRSTHGCASDIGKPKQEQSGLQDRCRTATRPLRAAAGSATSAAVC